MNLEQLALWAVPALGTAGAGGQAGLPKPTTTGANFWGPGGGWFHRPVLPGPAPGGPNHGGFRPPVWGKWIFGHHHPPGCPKRYKNDCPPGGVAELSSAIFTFGMGPPPAAALVAASQVRASGTISGVFGPNGCKNTPHGPDLASLVLCDAT